MNYRNPHTFLKGIQMFYLSDGYVPVIFEGNLGDTNGNAKIISYQYAYFDQIKIINSSKMVIRTHSSDKNENVLGILSIHPDRLSINKDAFEKKQDGIFETDGPLSS